MEFTGERFVAEKLKESDETYQEHMERYRFAVNYVKGLTVLDVACGAGYGSAMLAKEAARVFGIDVSAEAVNYARQNYGEKNVQFEVMDAKEIKYPSGSFDVVVSFETIEHISLPEMFLKEIKRVLKPNGLLIVSTPNLETTCDGKKVHAPYHVQEYTLQEMLDLLKDFNDKKVHAQKMTYHSRIYKKLRLLSRHVPESIKKRIVSCWKSKVLVPEQIPLVFKIPLYEYEYKAKVIPYVERNQYIKPTFFVIVCRS